MSAARNPVRHAVQRSSGAPAFSFTPELTPISVAMCLLVAAPLSFALPTGPVNTSGQATVQTTAPGQMIIQQSTAKAGLDWTSFSIAAGEKVQVVQPDRSSVLLNRVLGENPSLIYGSLQSNGAVWLINPRGIVFGANSRVDVGSLVASTLGINDDALQTGRLQLGAGAGGKSGAGELRSEGHITAIDGSVVLVAPNLVHSGQIEARRVGLAAASEVLVDVEGDGLIFFNVKNDALDTRLQVLGGVRADGGLAEFRAVARAGFADTVLNLDGVVQARSLGHKAGRIVVDGGPHGITRVAGALDASAEQGRGGDVLVQGEKILVTGTAQLNASGDQGGGRLRVGGGFQGRDAELRNAGMVTVAPGARLSVDAGQSGDGGELIVWSDRATRFYGAADARGGQRGGNGGLVEVSGKNYLDFRGSSDRSAPRGAAGQLLLDPTNLTIVASGPDIDDEASPATDDLTTLQLSFAAPGTNSRITALAVETQLGAGNVVLQANNDITVSAAINDAGGTNSLTLQAGNNITIGAPISLGGALTLSASDASANGGAGGTTTGAVAVNASIDVGGALTLTRNGTGVHTVAANLSAASLVPTGNLSITGASTWTLGAALGAADVSVANGGTLTLAAAALSGTTVTVNAGGTLTNNGANTVGALTLAGTLNGTTDLDASSAAFTAGTVARGLTLTGNATKTGAGTTTLQATLTAVNVDVNGGALSIGAGGDVVASGAVSVAGGAELQINQAGFSVGTLTGTGKLSVLADAVTLAGNLATLTEVSVSGSGSRLILGDGSGTRINDAASVSVGTGSTLQLGDTAEAVGALLLSGTLNGSVSTSLSAGAATLTAAAVNAELAVTGTLSSSGASTLTAPVTAATTNVTGGVLAVGNGGAGSLTTSGTTTLSPTAELAYNGTGPFTLGTVAGSGSTTLRVSAGALSLTGSASTVSNIAIGATGTLTLANGAARLGAGAALDVASGGTLTLGNTAETVASLTLGGTLAGAAALNVSGNAGLTAATVSNTLAVAGTLSATGANTISGLSLSGTLSGTGTVNAGTATLAGASVASTLDVSGALSSSGNSTLTGAVTAVTTNVTGGVLSVGNGGAGSLATSGTTTLSPTTELAFNGTGPHALGDIAGSGSTTLRVTAGTLNLNGTASTVSNIAVGSAGSLTLADGAARLGTAAALTVAGGGTLTLGDTAESVASLTLGGTVGGNSGLTVQNLNANIAATTPQVNNAVTVSTDLGVASGVTLTVGNGGAGSVATAGALNIAGTLVLNRNSNLDASTLIGSGTVTGGGTLRQAGSGTLNLDRSVTALGVVEATSGGLTLASANRIGDTATLSISNGATLTLANQNEAVDTFNLGGTLVSTGGNSQVTAGTYNLQSGAVVGADLGAGTVNVLSGGNGASVINNNVDLATLNLNVNAGATLEINNGNALVSGGSGTTVTVATGATLRMGAAQAVRRLTLGGTLEGAFTFTTHTGGGNGSTLGEGARIEVGSTLAGGAVTVTGNATLAGRITAGTVNINSGGVLSLTADGASGAPLAADHISNSARVNLLAGGTLQLAVNEEVDQLSGTGTLLGPGTLTPGTYFLTGTLPSNLTTIGALVVEGTGLIETNVTVNGTTTVNDAITLTVGNGSNGTLVSNAGVVVGTGATLAFNRNSAISFGSNVTGAGRVLHSGSGELSFTGAGTIAPALLELTGGSLTLDSGATDRLGDATAVLINANRSLTVNNASETIGSLTLAGTAGNAATVAGSGALSLGTLTAQGTGTVAAALLATTVNVPNGGALSLSAAGSLGTAANLSIATGGSLTLAADTTVATLSAGGSLLGSGHTLTTTGGSTLGSGAVVAANLSTATLDVTGNSTLSGTVSGSTALTLNGGVLTLSGSGPHLASSTGMVITATAGSGLALAGDETVASFTSAGTLSGGTNRLTSTGGHTLQTGAVVNAELGGSAALVVTGTATLNRAAETNTVSINNGGTLSTGAANVLADGANLTVANGGTLNLGAADTVNSLTLNGTVGSPASVAGSGTLTTGTLTATGAGSVAAAVLATVVNVPNGGALTLETGGSLGTGSLVTVDTGGSLALGSSSAIGSLAGSGNVSIGSFTLTTGSAGTSSFGGSITGSGNLTKVGAGTFTLASSQGYTGLTTVTGGTLALGASEVLADTGSVSVGSSGTLSVGNAETISNLTLSGALVGAGSLTTTTASVLGGATASLGALLNAATVNVSGTLATTAAERIGNSSNVNVLGGGALTLGGNETIGTSTLAGTLGGAFTLTATSHTLQTGGVVNLGTSLAGTSLLVTGSGTLDGQADVGAVTVSNGGTLTLGATANRVADGAAVTVNNGGRLVLAGNETVATLSLGGELDGVGLKLTADTTLTTGASVLANLGGSLLVVTDDATLTGTADSTALQITGGTLTLALANRLAPTTGVDVASGATLLLGGNQTLAALNGAGTINIGSAALTLAPTGNSSFSGSLSGSAAGSFVKQGAGTFTLAGNASAFTGITRVEAGTMAVTGTLASLQVDVTASGTLSLGSAERLANVAAVTVGPSATLTLTGTETVGTLTLENLLNGTGTLNATSVALNGATVASGANLGGGSLTSLGTSALNGTSAATTLAVNGGTLTLAGAGRLTGAPVTTVSGGLTTTLALQGNTTLGSLAGDGSVNLGGFTLGTGSAAGNTSFSGLISGSGGLTKQGSSTFTLGGGQTYTGATAVQAGTLATAAADVLPNGGSVTVDNGATLSLGGSDTIATLNLAGTLGGSGTLTASASTTLNTGAVVLANLGGPNLTVTGNATLTGTAAATSVLLNGGTLTLSSAGRLASTASVNITAPATLQFGGDQTFGSLAGNGNLGLSTFTLSTGSGGPSSFDGAISGSGGLVKQGNTTFALGGSHSYGGSTRVAAGTLALQADNVLPDASTVIVDGGATLALGGADTVAGLALTGTLGGAGTLTATSGYSFSTGAATLANANLGSGTLTVGGNSSLGGTAAGHVVVNTGTLSLAAADRLADTATVTVLGPATLLLAGADTVATLTLAGRLDGVGQTLTASNITTLQAGALVDANLAGATLNVAGDATLNGTAANSAINVNTGTLALGGDERLANTANLVVGGGTTLLLGGTETVGTLTVAGTLGNAGRLLNATSYTLQNGAAVLANLGAGTLASTGAVTLGGTSAADTVNINTGTLSLGAADRLADTATVSVASGATLLLNGNDTVFRLALSGVLGGTGTLSASTYTLSGGLFNTPLGGGDLTISADSTLNATSAATTVTVNGGTLTLGDANRFTAAPAVTVNAGTGLTLGGVESFGSLAGAGTVTLGAFTLTHLGLADSSFSGSLGVAGDTGGLVKLGGSNFTIGGTGIYTGNTRVEAGTLTLAGTLASLSLDVNGGSLVLTGADRLADAATVAVRNDALMTLTGNDRINSLALTGTLGGTGTLSANSVALDSGTVLANLGGGSLSAAGTSRLEGTSAATTLAVNGGTLTLASADRLTAAPVATVAGGATLAMQGALTLGSLAGGGAVNLGSFTLTTGGAGNSSYTGVLSGSGGLGKIGSSTFTLGGSNTYTGATQLLAGTLATAAADVLPNNTALTVASSATLTLGGNDSIASLVLGGSLNGAGTLTAATYALNGGNASAALGTGALSSTGSSTLAATSAATTVAVNSGTLTLAAANLLADSAALSVASGATLALSGNDSVASLTLAGTLGVTTGNTGTLTAASYALDGATVSANLGAGTLASSGSTTLAGTAGAGTVQVNGGTLNLASAGRLADNAQLTVASGATLRLNGDDGIGSLTLAGTLAGSGRLSATTVSLNSGNVVADVGATTLNSSGGSSVAGGANVTVLNVASGTLALASTAALSADSAATVASGATLALGGNQALGTLAGAGNVALGTFTLTTGSGGSSSFDGVISGTGGLNKAGTGSFTLGGANSYTGPTAVLAGTLATRSANVLPDASATSVASGATLALGGNDSVATLLLNGALQGSATLTATSYTLDGGNAIANLGAGRLVSTGSSTLAGSAAAGDVAVNSGTLVLGAANRLADTATVAVASGATLQLGGDDTITRADIAGMLTGTGTLNAATVALAGGLIDANLGGGVLSSSGNSRLNATSAATLVNVDGGTLTLGAPQRLLAAPSLTVAASSSVVLNGDQTLSSLGGAGNLGLVATTLRVGNGDGSSYAGSISGSGSLVKQGSGTLTLGGAHSYVGSTTIEAGTLALAAANRLPDNSAVAVATGATLALNGDETVASLALSGALAGNGTLNAASYALDSGNVIASLGAGALQSTGASRLAGSSAAGSVQVNGGTLALAAADRLADNATVAVASGAVLTLAGNDTVAGLALAGTLNGSGTLSAASYALSSGTVIADLGSGVLRSAGSSRLDGRSAATTLSVDGGSLTLGAADRLADSMAVSVASGAALVINATDNITSLTLAGTLSGSGTLSTTSTLMDGGRADANLAATTLTTRGNSTLAGTATAASVVVDSGTLTLASAQRLLALPVLQVNGGATLAFNGDQAVGSLAGAGNVGLNSFTLSTGSTGDSVFAGVISGSGGLVKQGSSSVFTLTGANSYIGATRINGGTLRVGDGGTSGSLATSVIENSGTLAMVRSDDVTLAQPVSGSGSVEQAGSGRVLFSGNNKTYSGDTVVTNGALATAGADELPDGSSVRVAATGRLALGGRETVRAVDADGSISLGPELVATADLLMRGAVSTAGAVQLTGGRITALNEGNRFGGTVSITAGGELSLSSGRGDTGAGAGTATGARDLVLGTVNAAAGGRVDAGLLSLTGVTTVTGGTLSLVSAAPITALAPGAELTNRQATSLPIAFAADAVLTEAGSRLNVAAGAGLNVVASNGGSVQLLGTGNSFLGNLSVVSGTPDSPWSATSTALSFGGATLNYAVQSRVRIAGDTVSIGGAGIVADVVALRADSVSTTGTAAIVARLPFDSTAGTATALPALTLELAPAAFALTFPFGAPGAEGGLRVSVGSRDYGNRVLPIDAGYVTVLPRDGASGTTAVLLRGPVVNPSGGYRFFFDGAGSQTQIPVFYNGVLPTTPQVENSISATVAVSEGARKAGFDDAVRTENVAVRLRAGVIAEVGPAPSATQGTEGLRVPAGCAPAPGALLCGSGS